MAGQTKMRIEPGQAIPVHLEPGQTILNAYTHHEYWEFIQHDGVGMIRFKPKFIPTARLTGLALRLLAISNAWRQT